MVSERTITQGASVLCIACGEGRGPSVGLVSAHSHLLASSTTRERVCLAQYVQPYFTVKVA